MFDWLFAFPTPGEIAEALGRPRRLHAALVHVPLGVSVLGVVLTFLMLLFRGSRGLRWATVAVLIVGAVTAFQAASAGERAAKTFNRTMLTQEAQQSLTAHESMGKLGWVFFLVATACVAVTAAPKPGVRAGMTILSFLVALATFAWLGATGYHGGELVYAHGVGVPTAAVARAPEAREESTPAEREVVVESAKPQAAGEAPASGADAAVEDGNAEGEGPDGHVAEPGVGE